MIEGSEICRIINLNTYCRRRLVVQQAESGGKPCPGKDVDVQFCSTNKCPSIQTTQQSKTIVNVYNVHIYKSKISNN